MAGPSASAAAAAAAATAVLTRAGPSSPTASSPRLQNADLSPPISFSQRTSSKNAIRDTYQSDAARHTSGSTATGSPPSTPDPRDRRRPRKKGKQPVRPPSTPGETSRPDKRYVVAREYDPRHSHGLSWSSTTKEGVVDNLIFALDNLSRPNVADSEDEPRDTSFDRSRYIFPGPATRPRGHTYSSSLSSDFDRFAMPMSPAGPGHVKGRRSQSGSSIVPQTNSHGRMRSSKVSLFGRTSTDTQKNIGTGAYANESHVKNESMSSTERGYTSTAAVKRPSWARRSMSMDQMYRGFGETEPSIIDRGRPVPSVHSKYESATDSAPEPMIPGGPRKMQNPTAIGAVYVNQAPPRTGTLRRITTQSDLRTNSQPLVSPIPPEIRTQASEFVRASSMRGQPVVPPPSDTQSSNPAQQTADAWIAPAAQQRERAGFFKRVFGGGSSRALGSSDRVPSLGYGDLAIPQAQRASSPASSQPRTLTRHTNKDQQSGTTSYPPVSLNKKPSSFFRRRKKSVSEPAGPPPLPLNGLQLEVQGPKASPSASSLRQVMDPYLLKTDIPPTKAIDLTRPPTHESSTEDSENPDIFHSGYTPPPDASLGNRDPISRSLSAKPPRSAPQAEGLQAMKMLKVKKRKGPEIAPLLDTSRHLIAERSFLNDASSREVSSTSLREKYASAMVSPVVDSVVEDKENQRPMTGDSQVSRASTGDLIIASKGTSPVECRDASADFGVLGAASNGVAPVESKKSVDQPEVALPREGGDHSMPVETSRQSSGARQTTWLGDGATGTVTSALQSPSSFSTQYHSATSLCLSPTQIESDEPRAGGVPDAAVESPVAPVPAIVSPTMADEGAEYRERARKIFEGDEEDVTKAEAAPWLGEQNTLSRRTLQAYMQLFDFTGLNCLAALRALCGNLVLKGETQQFDRIITALSTRWSECNPHHGFKAEDVVHTIFYSLILLNTDLHLADIGEKMSRSAYVKNTLPTIRRVVADAAPNAFDETIRPNTNLSASRPDLPWGASTGPVSPVSPSFRVPSPPPTADRTSCDRERPTLTKRLSMRPGFDRKDSDGWGTDSPGASGSDGLLKQSWKGSLRGWELEIESILKSFYASIRSDPLPLHGAPVSDMPPPDRNLTVNGLKRSGSTVSRTPSDNMSFRSKATSTGLRAMTLGFQSKYNRSRPKFYPASTMASSRTSFDDGNSVWSPPQSSNLSKYSFSKTLTSASMQSLSHFSHSNGDLKHSIGFANALSQAIIREESVANGQIGDEEPTSMSVPVGLLGDEALALEGAPWAKEGLVKHKHHLEIAGKKAKERSWNDVFAVISKGKLTLFAFNTSTKSHSMGRKALSKTNVTGRAASISTARVGGGDWMENAEQLDVFLLRQTIASTLPPPGYSRARPHVWALSLPNGAVHLFQVGTPEIAAEFMVTANYWAARLSKEPLAGSVSNIEYGWSNAVINPALLDLHHRAGSDSAVPARPSSPPPSVPPSSLRTHRPTGSHAHAHSNSGSGLPRPSFQSSLRTSIDAAAGGFGVSQRATSRLPADKIQLADWHAPTQSMMASQLMEVDQLKGLRSYVENVEAELARHNELKHAIELAYTPRHANSSRALSNWQRKSDYLLREIVKFQTYVESLKSAQVAKEKFDARKAAHLQQQHQANANFAGATESPAAGDEIEKGNLDAVVPTIEVVV